jgi:hypothetical protein
MDKLTEKQRKIIRLAFTSKDPELRRKAVERVIEARYTEEFKQWADAQGEVFRNPDTGNMNRFNSIPSQAQKEVFRRWEGGEYEAQGGPPAGGRGDGDEGGGGGGGGGEPGRKYSDRTELRGKPKKQMEDAATLTDEDLEEILPVEDIRGKRHGERILEGIKGASYADLDALYESTKYLAANPDDEFSKNHWLRKNAGLSGEDLKKFHAGLGKKLVDAKGRLYSETVLQVANRNDLEGIDADSVRQFRIDKPATGRQLTPEQLKQKFLQGPWVTDQKQRERIQKMSPDEFMAMRNAILSEEEEEELNIAEGGTQVQAADDLRLFERPPEHSSDGGADKMAHLTPVGRKIVRIAYESKDPKVRTEIVKLVRAQRGS